MNKGLNECLEFSFELNTEVNDFLALFNDWMNNQNLSPRAMSTRQGGMLTLFRIMTSSGCYLLLDRQTNKPADIFKSCVENILKKAPKKTIYFWNSFQKIALLQWHHQVVKLRMNKKSQRKRRCKKLW